MCLVMFYKTQEILGSRGVVSYPCILNIVNYTFKEKLFIITFIKFGAAEKTRTSKDCSTATSTLRVYQFRHSRKRILYLIFSIAKMCI